MAGRVERHFDAVQVETVAIGSDIQAGITETFAQYASRGSEKNFDPPRLPISGVRESEVVRGRFSESSDVHESRARRARRDGDATGRRKRQPSA